MIKDKEQIKMEMKEEIFEIIDKYVEEMDEGLNKDKFPISVIEKMLGQLIGESKNYYFLETSRSLLVQSNFIILRSS